MVVAAAGAVVVVEAAVAVAAVVVAAVAVGTGEKSPKWGSPDPPNRAGSISTGGSTWRYRPWVVKEEQRSRSEHSAERYSDLPSLLSSWL